MIKSTSTNEQEILQSILKLHCGNKTIDLDPTYSKGNFYKTIPEPIFKFDITPQTIDTKQSEADNLPFEDSVFNTIMFDPPFLATTGKSLKSTDSNNAINKRFGVYPDEKSLHSFYISALHEFYRLLKENGILIFKCQDKVSSGKQYFTHCFIEKQARAVGFYPVDLFILLASNRIVADWQLKNQQHARKFHSYFWVFKKSKKQVHYI